MGTANNPRLVPGYAYTWWGWGDTVPRTENWDIVMITQGDVDEAQCWGDRTIDGARCDIFFAYMVDEGGHRTQGTDNGPRRFFAQMQTITRGENATLR